MASPQKENGYTPIANEILDNIMKSKLNGTQFRIVMCVWRYTYGFSRKQHELSETYISQAIECNKKQVQRELTELIKSKILIIEKDATFNSSRILSFNKNYVDWLLISGQVADKIPPIKIDTQTGSGLAVSTGSGLDPQDKQDLKQIIKQKKPSCPKKVFSDDSQEIILSKRLFDLMLINNPNAKEPNWQTWAKYIDLAIRKDKRTVDQLKTIIEWCQKDSFWYTNILSTSKLRDQFDALTIKMNKNNPKTGERKVADF